MRLRLLAPLSALALAAIVLAGCAASSTSNDASPSPSPSDLCAAKADEGAATDAVTVTGETGKPSEAAFTVPLDVPTLESSLLSEGSGDPIADGQYVQLGLTAYDASTGEKLGEVGYTPGSQLPTQVSADYIGQLTGCATVGSRLVVAWPATEASTDPTTGQAVPAGNAQVYVLDVLGVTPTAAWGADQDPTAGFPTVALADNGEPTITVPDGSTPPAATETEVLKKGDGITVESGDQVLVQYTGVKQSDGSVFDSSWSRGAPAVFPTDQVVTGFQTALVGQTVGSQVVAVIPPAEGYGAAEGNELQNETLVFVVDILATQHAAAAQ